MVTVMKSAARFRRPPAVQIGADCPPGVTGACACLLVKMFRMSP